MLDQPHFGIHLSNTGMWTSSRGIISKPRSHVKIAHHNGLAVYRRTKEVGSGVEAGQLWQEGEVSNTIPLESCPASTTIWMILTNAVPKGGGRTFINFKAFLCLTLKILPQIVPVPKNHSICITNYVLFISF